MGPVSGAHSNPAVTLKLCVAREICASLALGYILSQICGGLAGTILAHLMFDLPLVQIATANRASLPLYCAEFIATAELLSVILISRDYRPLSLSFLVGLYISADYWFTSSNSFATPAVTLARMFTDSFSGIAPSAVLFFIIVKLLAGWPFYKLSTWLTYIQNTDNQGQKLILNTSPSIPMMSAIISYSTKVSCVQTPNSLYLLRIRLSRLIQTKNRGQGLCLNVV